MMSGERSLKEASGMFKSGVQNGCGEEDLSARETVDDLISLHGLRHVLLYLTCQRFHICFLPWKSSSQSDYLSSKKEESGRSN